MRTDRAAADGSAGLSAAAVQGVLSAVDAPLFLFDTDGRPLATNPAAAERYDDLHAVRPAGEGPVGEVDLPDRLRVDPDPIRRAADGEPQTIERRYRTDGGVVRETLALRRLPTAEATCVLGTVRPAGATVDDGDVDPPTDYVDLDVLGSDDVDVADSDPGEEALRSFRRAVDHTAHAVYVTDVDGTIEYVNPAFEELTGYAAAEAVGRTPDILQSDVHDESFHADLWETVLAGEQWAGEVTNERADGGEVVFDQTVSPVLDDDGEPVQFVAVATDVTDRRTEAARLESQLETLEVLNQVVRHDIRNDLQLVSAYADILDGTLEDRAQQHLDIITRSADNAIGLTTTARDLTTAMLQTDADLRAIPLASRLGEQIERLLSARPEASVTVDGSIPSVDVVADDLLGAVFRNVLKNAVQHNDTDHPTVTVAAAVDDGRVVLRFTDDGPGVPDARKADVFGRGEQGLESAGTGLGLYLVDTLVERYGGDVWIEDNVPRGAIVVIELPLAA